MRNHAVQLNVTGWVRNCMDGTVEAMVQGEPGAVDAIVQWAHRGPQAAQVKTVQIEVADGEQDFQFFEKLPTL